MKKPTLNLLAAAAVATLLVSAHAAQPPDQNNNGAPPPGAPISPPTGEQSPMPAGGNPPDAGGPQTMPADTNAVPGQEQSMPADAAQGNNGATPGDNNNMAPGDNNSAAAGNNAMPGENADNNTDNNAPGGSTVITPGRNRIGSQDVTSEFVPPAELGTNADQLKLNFRNAPLEMVLNYLSDAAGFIIDLQTHVNGNVSVISAHPMTRDEAVDLLNAVLNRNGYAAIRHGRRLTIVDKNDAKTQNIPVISGNDPAAIPDNAEIITQIIPIRFVDARQLVSDLTSFVSPQATVVANDAGNSIVITDTQQNIKHLTEIIRAIDDSAEAETEIKVFPLKFASPVDVANELGSVFPSSTSGSGGTQAPIRFGGGGGGFGRFFGGGGGGGFGGGGFGGGGAGAGAGGGTSDRIRKETQVTAVADSRIQAVIVTAPKDLMDEIGQMMTQLDVPSDRDQKVYVFNMKNGDPQAALTVLQSMFQTSSSRGGGTSGSTSSQNMDPLTQRIQSNVQSSSSTSSSGFSSGFSGGGGRTGAQY